MIIVEFWILIIEFYFLLWLSPDFLFGGAPILVFRISSAGLPMSRTRYFSATKMETEITNKHQKVKVTIFMQWNQYSFLFFKYCWQYIDTNEKTMKCWQCMLVYLLVYSFSVSQEQKYTMLGNYVLYHTLCRWEYSPYKLFEMIEIEGITDTPQFSYHNWTFGHQVMTAS